ncbi:MAG: N-acetyltransferase [Methanotrichaceae archaeon]|nr:N-acetyltransferase [Methanotrichaceae archaeon]
MTYVREEIPEDIEAIRKVNLEAFGEVIEADIVDRLRESCEDLLSLVAVHDGKVSGHILFSPMTIDDGVVGITRIKTSSGDHPWFSSAEKGGVVGMGLAPLAVLPDLQRKGIGSLLVRAGIAALRDRGCPFVILLGHPEYYPRFGFERASLYGIRCQWDVPDVDVPDEAFMILVIDREAMAEASGVARYGKELDEGK